LLRPLVSDPDPLRELRPDAELARDDAREEPDLRDEPLARELPPADGGRRDDAAAAFGLSRECEVPTSTSATTAPRRSGAAAGRSSSSSSSELMPVETREITPSLAASFRSGTKSVHCPCIILI
jgi:hypothetical protein